MWAQRDPADLATQAVHQDAITRLPPLERSQDQAVQLLRRALGRLTLSKRARFWQEYISGDALLDPLRGHPGFDRLDREYGR